METCSNDPTDPIRQRKELEMSERKVYFSKTFNPSFDEEDSNYMTFFLIPNKWWSIKDWKFAMSFRAKALSHITSWMNLRLEKP